MNPVINFTQDLSTLTIAPVINDVDDDPSNIINRIYESSDPAHVRVAVVNPDESITLDLPNRNWEGTATITLNGTNESNGSGYTSAVDIRVIGGTAATTTWEVIE